MPAHIIIYKPLETGGSTHSPNDFTTMLIGFNRLKGEDDVADFVGLSVPDEFDLAFVFKQQEAVFVGQRFVCLNKADDLLLFLFCESWHRFFR